MHKAKSRVAGLFIIGSLPVLLFFQNCGKAGNSASLDTSAANLNSTPSSTMANESDSFTIGLSSANKSSGSTLDGNPQNDVHISEPVLNAEDEESAPAKEGSDDNDSTKHRCAGLNIADILLSVESIEGLGNSNNHTSLLILDNNKTLSLGKLNLKIQAFQDMNLDKIFLKLNPQGNRILNERNQSIDLNSPSGKSVGLKVHLSQPVQVLANQIYNLEVSINPAEQLISNQHKCVLKPLLKDASLVQL